tara:strand:+ start:373 stop:669 length:297 start_codon:yes stop_codon:yes gene_type:complete
VKEDRVYLKHILRCIRRIEEYTAKGSEDFLSSPMAHDATLRNLQTMAESTQRLSAPLKEQIPLSIGARWPVSATSSCTTISVSTWNWYTSPSRSTCPN